MKKAPWFLAAVALGWLYVWSYRRELRSFHNYGQNCQRSARETIFPGLSPQDSLDLGMVYAGPGASGNSYVRYAQAKGRGTLRIGVFGDLRELRGEALPRWQSALSRELHRKVEVLDFSVPGSGVPAAHLFWSKVGRKFNLDCAVFIVQEPDLSGNLSFLRDPFAYGPFHARYVLEDGRLRLIHVAGKSLAEAAEIYYRPWPAWQYLRYDRRLPPFLRILLPYWIGNFPNPFYYWPPSYPDKEIEGIYLRLFKDVIDQSEEFVLIATNRQVIDIARRGFVVPDGYACEAGLNERNGVRYGSVAASRLPLRKGGVGAGRLVKALFDLPPQPASP